MPRVNKNPSFGDFDRGFATSLGVKALFMLDVQSGCIVEAVTGDKYAITSGTVVSTPEGYAIQYDGTQQQTITLRPNFFTSNSRDWYVAGRIAPTAQQAGNPGAIFGVSASSGNQTHYGIGWDNSATPLVGAVQLTTTAAAYITGSGKAAALRQFNTVFANTEPGSGTNGKAWVDGVARAATPLTGAQNTGDEVVFGAQHRSAGFLRQAKGWLLWGAIIYYPTVISNSYVDDNVMWSLYANDFPYNLFRRTRRLWPAAAAVATKAPPPFQRTIKFLPRRYR